MNRHEVTVMRRGTQLAVHAPFLTELIQEAVTDAWLPERRAEFEEFGYAVAQLQKAVDADGCISGPSETSEETERLVGEAEARWTALDLGTVAFLDEKTARALYQALGVALLAADKTVVQRIPAGVAA